MWLGAAKGACAPPLAAVCFSPSRRREVKRCCSAARRVGPRQVEARGYCTPSPKAPSSNPWSACLRSARCGALLWCVEDKNIRRKEEGAGRTEPRIGGRGGVLEPPPQVRVCWICLKRAPLPSSSPSWGLGRRTDLSRCGSKRRERGDTRGFVISCLSESILDQLHKLFGVIDGRTGLDAVEMTRILSNTRIRSSVRRGNARPFASSSRPDHLTKSAHRRPRLGSAPMPRCPVC